MYRRLIILTAVIVAAVCGLGGLGFHAIGKWSQGLEGARLGEFAEVAEQVRQDVKRKLDEFVRVEQQRQYTDYLYSYVPENIVNSAQLPMLRSPLADQLSNGFAYGYFQVDPDGSLVSPYYPAGSTGSEVGGTLAKAVQDHFSNIRYNVFPSISLHADALKLPATEADAVQQNAAIPPVAVANGDAAVQAPTGKKGFVEGQTQRAKAYPIESLKQDTQQAQVFQQQRMIANFNQVQTAEPQGNSGQAVQAPSEQREVPRDAPIPSVSPAQQADHDAALADTVQVRVEPFVPLVVPDPNRAESVFGGQVFLLRHVQIENRHLLQGFQLDESRLVAEVKQSARSFVREGMGFELPQVRKADGQASDAGGGAAYTAILDFGFGDLVLNLVETDPAWIVRRIGELRRIYLAIIAIVVAAVGLSLLSLWHNVRAQAMLAQKKDDFISAVSHELRTPLTSIRMYTEMLEKNWVKSAEKVDEYHRTMRQESERLSRLVENVLDFARLQKGRKNYAFRLGSIDECVAGVVEMMRPYAEQHGFTIQTDLAAAGQTRFDKDAVTQIIVNLVDNAVKYARSAADKTISVRTRSEPGFTVIEVQDHGPGIPRHQQKKVFEQFYRCDDDGRYRGPSSGWSPTTGMGLGLTLVKRFAEAHEGYVEVRDAEPTGVVLKVVLATQLTTSS
ncbi:MAG: HAMP domain-containing sensor histidine kinase [Phycisphaerales bacterium]